MKILPLLLAVFAISAFSGASAKSFQCIDGVLRGGPDGFTCRVDAEGKIVDVRRADLSVRGPVTAGTYGYSHHDRYTRSQTYVAPAPAARTITRTDTRSGTAPRVTRSYSYASPSYQAAPEVTEVRVYRGGAAGSARPCTYYAPETRVTTYTGCEGGPVVHKRMTMYLDPAPELQGARYAPPHQPHSAPYASYDYTAVVGMNAGICDRKIARLNDDSDGRTRYEVCYADLQPVYGGRVEALYSRIETAARRACGPSAGYGAYATSRDCRKLAVEMAVYDTGLQSLVNHHVAETGGRPRVIVGPLRRY